MIPGICWLLALLQIQWKTLSRRYESRNRVSHLWPLYIGAHAYTTHTTHTRNHTHTHTTYSHIYTYEKENREEKDYWEQSRWVVFEGGRARTLNRPSFIH